MNGESSEHRSYCTAALYYAAPAVKFVMCFFCDYYTSNTKQFTFIVHLLKNCKNPTQLTLLHCVIQTKLSQVYNNIFYIYLSASQSLYTTLISTSDHIRYKLQSTTQELEIPVTYFLFPFFRRDSYFIMLLIIYCLSLIFLALHWCLIDLLNNATLIKWRRFLFP